jgi:hypothetical protein
MPAAVMNDAESRDAGDDSRRWVPIAIVVLATMVGLLSIFALWAKRQLLETESWTETSSELLENEDISNAVADFLVAELFDNVDVPARIEAVLPAEFQGLAEPVAGGIRQVSDDASRKALQEPKVQSLWEEANRTAHEQLLAIVDDESTAVSRSDGTVVLDLVPLLEQLAKRVGLSGERLEKLPDEAAEIEIMREDELDAAQSGVKLLRTLAWLLTAIAIGLYVLAIYLARGRRRETLRAVGFGFITIGVLVLFARNLGGDAVTDALASTSSAEPAVGATWEIGTSMLKEGGQAVLAYGVLIVLAAWLAGPTTLATRLRGYAAPYLLQRRVAYAVLAILLVLVFWWAPTEATKRIVPSLVLIALAVIGLEALRSVSARERT